MPLTADRLRKFKCGLFSERESTDDVIEYIEAAITEPQYRSAAIVGAMMMYNTLLEQLSIIEEKQNVTDS